MEIKINYNNYIFFDFETGSKNAEITQPTQLSAVAINCRKLEIIPNGIFDSYIRPELDDAKAIELGLEPIQDEALEITKITREQLVNAPLPETVWKNFIFWASQFNRGGGTGEWSKSIAVGFNIIGFDIPIVKRLCKQYKTAYPFHPLYIKDIIIDVFNFTENAKINDNDSNSMDSVRKWMGISEENAHNAKKDVLDGAFLAIKFMKMYRHFYPKIKFKDSFAKENEEIKILMKE